MADISKITLPNGITYDVKDASAREDIEDLERAISGGVKFIGETTTPLEDGSTVSTVTINGASVLVISGNLVVYGNKEFVFDGTKWIEMGDLDALGTLAWKNSASATYTPVGAITNSTAASAVDANKDTEVVTAVTTSSDGSLLRGVIDITENAIGLGYTGDATSVTVSGTPEGTVSAPVISVSSAGTTTTVNSITTVGSLPALGATVTNEVLTLTWDAGSLPTKGADTTVKTGDASYSASAPSFTGTSFDSTGSCTSSGTVTFKRYVNPNISVSVPYIKLGTVATGGTTEYLHSEFTGTEATITST